MIDVLESRVRPSKPDPASIAAAGREAMISTSHPAATAAGLAALRRGGSAVDAYIAAAAVQAVVEPTMTGFGGGFSITVFEPATGRSRLAAGVGLLPQAEDANLDDEARWSGRTVVPPGWVSGAYAAWQKWGRLSWAELFADALGHSRDGFVIDQQLWGTLWQHRAIAARYPAGRETWWPDGHLVSVGDVLRQPALARTIEGVAEQGPAFVYQGEFARHYVDTARVAGGRITLDDMAAAGQGARELELPVLPVAGGYELHTTGFMYALALNLAAAGKLTTRGRPAEDAGTLYLLMRLVEETWHHCLALVREDRAMFTVEALSEVGAAVSEESAEKLWPQIESGPPRPFSGMNLETCAIVAVDSSGTVAYGTHSTSSPPFGVGLVADGVILTRPLYYFANPVVTMPVGWGTFMLLLRDGRPVFAAASPSVSAVQNVLQNTLNVTGWGMTPGESVQQPLFGSPVYPSTRPMVEVSMGDAHIAAVEQRGLRVARVAPWEQEMGSCHAVRFGEDGTLHGAADPRRLGRVAGC